MAEGSLSCCEMAGLSEGAAHTPPPAPGQTIDTVCKHTHAARKHHARNKHCVHIPSTQSPPSMLRAQLGSPIRLGLLVIPADRRKMPSLASATNSCPSNRRISPSARGGTLGLSRRHRPRPSQSNRKTKALVDRPRSSKNCSSSYSFSGSCRHAWSWCFL